MKPPRDDAEYRLRKAMGAIIRPIVMGQLRACRKEHPHFITGAGIASIEKRIINDLLSRGSFLRLRAVLCACETSAEDRPGEAVVHHCGRGVRDGSDCLARSLPP